MAKVDGYGDTLNLNYVLAGNKSQYQYRTRRYHPIKYDIQLYGNADKP